MTTSAIEQEAAEQGAVPYPPYSSIEFSPQPYQKVVVYLSGHVENDNTQIDYALERFWHGYLKNEKIAAEYAPKPQSASPNGAQRPQPQQRASGSRQSVYPPDGLVSTLEDGTQWTCDICGGSGTGVARRPMTGKMRSDAIVCLNPSCKEGNFRHTIAWDDGPVDNGQPDLDPDSMPF